MDTFSLPQSVTEINSIKPELDILTSSDCPIKYEQDASSTFVHPFLNKKVPIRMFQGRPICAREVYFYDYSLSEKLDNNFNVLQEITTRNEVVVDLSENQFQVFEFVIDQGTSQEYCDRQSYWFKTDALLSATTFRLDRDLLHGHSTHIVVKKASSIAMMLMIKQIMYLTMENYFEWYGCCLPHCTKEHYSHNWLLRMQSFLSCTFDQVFQSKRFQDQFLFRCQKFFSHLGLDQTDSQQLLTRFWMENNCIERVKNSFKLWTNPLIQKLLCVKILNLKQLLIKD